MQLRIYRERANLTLAELSRKADVDISILSRLERQPKKTASYQNTCRIAWALGIEASELEPVDPPAYRPLKPRTTKRRTTKRRRPAPEPRTTAADAAGG